MPRRFVAIVAGTVVACTTFGARADGKMPGPEATAAPKQAPPDVQTAPRRTGTVWAIGARGEYGAAAFGTERLCILETTGCGGYDVRDYTLAGALAYVAFGGPGAHVVGHASLELLYGPGKRENFGSMFAGRLLAGPRYLSNPGGPASFVFELASGLSYYGMPSSSGASAPMLASSLVLGGKVDDVELLGRVTFDSFFGFYVATTAMVAVGVAFDLSPSDVQAR